MAKHIYKIFPNKVELFRFFGKYNETINVSASARLPLNGLALGNKMKAFRTFPEFYQALADLSGLDIDTKASTTRMGAYIVFFNKELASPTSESVVEVDSTLDEQAGIVETQEAEVIDKEKVEEEQADVDAILAEAAALRDENDKAGSKAKLISFAESKGVSLKGNKTFDTFLSEFEAALRA